MPCRAVPHKPGAAHCSITQSFPSSPLKHTAFYLLENPVMRPICADRDILVVQLDCLSVLLGKLFRGDKVSSSVWLGLALQI